MKYNVLTNDQGLLKIEAVEKKHKPTGGFNIYKEFKGFTYINDKENELLIVQHKKKFKISPSKQLKKGEKLIMVMDSDKIRNFKFIEEAFVNGMCIYQKYNEDTQILEPILKGYTADDIKGNEEFFDWYGISLDVQNDGIKIISKNYNITPITELDLSDKDIDYILSYILGIVAIYGIYDIKEDRLVNVKVDIPINIMYSYKYEELVHQIKEKLIDNKIIINISLDIDTTKNFGTLSFVIYDYEFINFMIENLDQELSDYKINKYEYSEKFKKDLIQYLEEHKEEINNYDETKELLKNNIKVID